MVNVEAHMGKSADPTLHQGRLVPALLAWSLLYAIMIVGSLSASHTPETHAAAPAANIEASIR
jgi:hypothetical protein